MMNLRPYVLTIAGFDPSGGAGLVADVKTFEAHQVMGLSVCSAITVQNDVNLRSCEWMDFKSLKNQLNCLLERFEIQFVKIGIIKSWSLLLRVVSYLNEILPTVTIVLDPVLKSTSNYDFHSDDDMESFDQILKLVDLITPNYDEIEKLYGEKTIDDTIEHMTVMTNVYLKGGHRQDEKGVDVLHTMEGEVIRIEPTVSGIKPKHGTGCVLSASLTASLAKGQSLESASFSAKRYVEQYMNSNQSLLGYHML